MSAPVTHCKTDLLTWKDPVKTGKVFGSIILSLVIFKTVNLLNLFFHLAYIGLLVSAAAEYSGKLITGQGFVTKYKPSTKSCVKKINETVLPKIAEFNERLEAEFQRVVYAQDVECTLKTAGASYVLYKITSWFSLFTLIAAAVVITFTVPAIYIKNKKEIDAAVAQYSKLAKDKTSDYTKLAHEKAAPHIENLIKKTGPVGSYISSKIPTRTAGTTVGSDRSTAFEKEADTASTATTTGASKFPDVPSSSLPENSSIIEDVIAEAKSSVENATSETPSTL